MLCVEESQVFSSTIEALLLAPALLYLVSQARPTSAKREGSGELRIQAMSCRTVQSHCSILSHDALHDCLSSNSSLENGERELGHLFRYCRSCKNTLTVILKHAYSARGKFKSELFDIWLHHPANCIPVDMACIRSSPDPSLLLRKWVGPARLHHITD